MRSALALLAEAPLGSASLRGGFAALLAFAVAGCVSYESGTIAAVSAETLPLAMTFVAERVEGRSCLGEEQSRFPLAIDDAIRRAPGANALVDASLHFERLCLLVRGKAVRVEPAGALDETR